MSRALPFGLLFLSGFTALVYEVLWLEELGLLFGNAAHAAATTLAVFFLGLAAGGLFWGRRAARLRAPLAVYGLLEVGIAVTGLLYFLLLDAYRLVYQPLYAVLGEAVGALAAAKLLLALGILFPPAFLMGGTLPVLGEHLVRAPRELGRTGSLLYLVNTGGAALGALAAGFFLPPLLGYARSYLLAVALSATVGAVAVAVARREKRAGTRERAGDQGAPPGRGDGAVAPRATGTPSGRRVLLLAFLSGFLALGLEVAWTRMFAQVLQNSVYTFSAILAVFLLALAVGGGVANRLCRLRAPAEEVLAVLLAAAGLAVASVPVVFHGLTDGLGYVGAGAGWGGYLSSVLGTTLTTLFLPGVLVGAVFPYLLRLEERRTWSAGRSLGVLAAVNTVGAIAGSLGVGFVLLDRMGLWGTTTVLGAAYPLAAAGLLATTAGVARRAWVGVGVVVVLLPFLSPLDLPRVRRAEAGERVLEVRESSYGVVAVVERESGLRIKVDNFYSLGGTAALDHERNQALIPAMAHPDPDSIFFLGMGTGITAGAVLGLPVDRVTVAELVPDVIAAARTHFGPYTSGLFEDPRSLVLARDGRNHLYGSPERYDLIVADLFVPWRAGAGKLYRLEHFRTARTRLRPGGWFVQWLPLYQLTAEEFWTVARTMLAAFPSVQVWRGDFYAENPILALVGAEEAVPLDPQAIARAGRALGGARGLPDDVYHALSLLFYAGTLSQAPELVPPGPLNTDDRPVIEYRAPRSHREARAGRVPWFTGPELLRFLTALQAAVPPDEDPALARVGARGHDLVRAGLLYHRASVLQAQGRREEAQGLFRRFLELMPFDFRPATGTAEPSSDFGG